MSSTKVLMFGDTAFVGSTIANYWRDHGYQFKIYELNLNNRDVWYAGMNSVKLINHTEEFRIDWDADIVHVHFYWQAIPNLREVFPNAKFILSLHGSDLRLTGWKRILDATKEHVLLYTVSTIDLFDMPDQPPNCSLMVNAPDMVMIGNKRAKSTRQNLHLIVAQSHGNLVIEHCQETDKKVVQRRDMGEIYPRKTYFHFLSHFRYFHDHKTVNGKTLGLSLTAIEFLAMGGEVHHNGEWIDGLPKEYNHEFIMRYWGNIYTNSLK